MQSKVPCPKCGEENYATDAQCMACGAVLGVAGQPTAQPGRQPAAPGRPAPPVPPGVPARVPERSKKKFESVLLSQPTGAAIGAFVGTVPVFFLQRFLFAMQVEDSGMSSGAVTAFVGALCLALAALAAWTFHDLGDETTQFKDWRLWLMVFASGFIGLVVIFLGAYLGGGVEYLISKRGSGKSARGG